MINLEVLEKCLQAIKDCGYYDDTTSIVEIEFKEDYVGTLYFECQHGCVCGFVDFNDNAINIVIG